MPWRSIRQELGSLDRVQRIVRVVGHVASASGFVQQPAVINGASDLLVQVFGEAGRHARVALGAAELPLHAAIELELLVQVDHKKLSRLFPSCRRPLALTSKKSACYSP
jgi:enamine deaminase RidA (YjgF/YER057c/UK114 family)